MTESPQTLTITIDGPAGSGKSTAARNLAAALNIAYLDTGAMYRALTLKALEEQVDLEDEAALTEMARRAKIDLIATPTGVRVLLDGHDVSTAIRTARVTDHSHFIARAAGVREQMVRLQRETGAALRRFVTEGRDQGSVVFPEADCKFYLVADPAERARRRCDEMRAAGQQADYDEILAAIQQRDRRDSTRAAAPLVKPDGAIEIDTSRCSPQQVVEAMLARIEGL